MTLDGTPPGSRADRCVRPALNAADRKGTGRGVPPAAAPARHRPEVAAAEFSAEIVFDIIRGDMSSRSSKLLLQALNATVGLLTMTLAGLSLSLGSASPVYGDVELPDAPALDSNKVRQALNTATCNG